MWKKNKNREKILIVGGFHKAKTLAKSLVEKNYSVTIVNKSYEDCEKLAELNKVRVIFGDGSKRYILEEAGAADCRIAIVLTNNDETNLVICEMCKYFFKLEKTVCLLNDSSKTDFFYEMGVDRAVCALNMITNLMEENALMDTMMQMIPTNGEKLHIAEATMLHNSSLIGKKLWELNLPKEIIIGCILRGEQSLIPRGDTCVQEGDTLLMITSNKDKLDEMKELTKQ